MTVCRRVRKVLVHRDMFGCILVASSYINFSGLYKLQY